jgi:hypothetical protein
MSTRFTRRATGGCGSGRKRMAPPWSSVMARCATCPWPRHRAASGTRGWTGSPIGAKGGCGCRPSAAGSKCVTPPAVRCSSACANRRAALAAWRSTASSRSPWTAPTSCGSPPGAVGFSVCPLGCRPSATCQRAPEACGIPPSTRRRHCRMGECGWPLATSASMKWTPAACACGGRFPWASPSLMARCGACFGRRTASSGPLCRKAACGARPTMPAASNPWPRAGPSAAPARLARRAGAASGWAWSAVCGALALTARPPPRSDGRTAKRSTNSCGPCSRTMPRGSGSGRRWGSGGGQRRAAACADAGV